jgi:alpha-methylacyl-CoA racemase
METIRMSQATGPLSGLRVIEMAGIGPGPFCGMLLADMGADVIVIERPAALRTLGAGEAMNRGKRSICLDLKNPLGLRAVQALVRNADALIEGYRPGVMERLGLGPEALLPLQERLVYARVTGWGQTGPLAHTAGHDINYVALTGALSIATRHGVAPSLPATLLGDMAGGAMFAAFGIVCALLEAKKSGKGQVIDAAMVDGVGMLTALVHSLRNTGLWSDTPAQNFFLHSSPFYDSFECADGRYLSLGAIEPQFYRELLQRLDLQDIDPGQQYDASTWPVLRQRIADRIRTRSRDEWAALLDGTDACAAPVLTLAEAAQHPHQRSRGNFVEVAGQFQPAPAPRLSRTPARQPEPGPAPGSHTATVLAELGFAQSEIDALTN